MIKVYVDGARFYGDQISRIEEGFVKLNCEITPHAHLADIIYSNNPSPTRTQLTKDKLEGKLKPGVKLVYCVLDVPMHLWDTESFQKEIPQIKADLAAADAVCSISEYTQRMVKEKYGFDSTVIYNPIMNVSRGIRETPQVMKSYKYLSVGRRYDPNKRYSLAAQALMLLGVDQKEVGNVGSEVVNFGENLGVLREDYLSNQYNLAKFVLCPSLIEGLNLPVIEAMACGSAPIACNDMTTRQELLPSHLFPEYDEIEPNPHSIAAFIYKFSQPNWAYEELRERIYSHYINNLRVKFDKVEVATRILKAVI